jgi:hypothetical protein
MAESHESLGTSPKLSVQPFTAGGEPLRMIDILKEP